MRLSKPDSRKRLREIRELWCQWDPIGIMTMSDWPRDEYDSYLGPTLRLLESGASLQKIIEYLMTVELDRMGLSETPRASAKPYCPPSVPIPVAARCAVRNSRKRGLWCEEAREIPS